VLELAKLIDRDGPAEIALGGELGGHSVIIDEINLNHLEGARATLRDPWHGWQITVGVDSLYRRLSRTSELQVIQCSKHDPRPSPLRRSFESEVQELSSPSVGVESGNNGGSNRNLSSLLKDILANSNAGRTDTQPRNGIGSVEFSNSDGSCRVDVEEGSISLSFPNKDEKQTIHHGLSEQEFSWLSRYLKTNADNFSPKFSNNLEGLRKAVNYAKLHAAFYGADATPKAAAEALTAFLQRTIGRGTHKDWPAASITMKTNTDSYGDRVQKLMSFAEAMSNLGGVIFDPRMKTGINEGAVERVKAAAKKVFADKQLAAGQELLERIFASSGSPSKGFNFEDVIAATTKAIDAEQGNATVTITVRDKRYDHTYFTETISIERTPTGLQLYLLNKSSKSEFRSLNDLIDLLKLRSEIDDSRSSSPRWDFIGETLERTPLRDAQKASK
jgi:hypothetical protein